MGDIGFSHAIEYSLTDTLKIKLLSAPYFIATIGPASHRQPGWPPIGERDLWFFVEEV